MANITLANKCGVCGSWTWCGRQCSSSPVRVVRWPGYEIKQMTRPVAREELSKSVPLNSGAYRYRDPDKRRAYQRDLMRKRRAK